jgi:NAD(P)H-dependent FMN reductase
MPSTSPSASRIRILAISGSLRSGSSNTALLRAASSIAPSHMELRLCERIDRLPFFDPDLDDDGGEVPSEVEQFRAELRATDGVLISSPEYAHGVPGVLKNALDWLVGSTQGEIVEKPVALINASPRATHAQASLVETLRTMSAHIVADVALPTSITGRALDTVALQGMPGVVGVISSALAELESAIRTRRART